MLGTAGLPHVIVRFFTVPRVKDARKSAGYALLFIAILYTTAPAVAAFGMYNLLNDVNEAEIAELPVWVDNWERTGLISITDTNADGRVQYHSDPAVNELNIDQDIMVLASPEIAQLPGWVIGMVAAGGVAAALSTAAGLLLVISTSISHDLLKKQIWPSISEKGELIAARSAAFTAILVAGYFGINPPDYVAATVALAFGLAAASFFPAIFMGIFYKRMNSHGAIAGMVTGLGITIFYILKFKFELFGGGGPDDWWFGVSPEGFGTFGMLANFAAALIVSYFTKEPPVEIQELVEDIRIPRGAGSSYDH